MPKFVDFKEMARKRQNDIDVLGHDASKSLTERFGEDVAARIRVNALTPFNLYKPLDKRLAQVLSNLQSNDSSINGGTSVAGVDNKGT